MAKRSQWIKVDLLLSSPCGSKASMVTLRLSDIGPKLAKYLDEGYIITLSKVNERNKAP